MALLSFSLACGEREGTPSAGSPVAPQLAGISCKKPASLPKFPGEPSPTVAEELCASGAAGYVAPSDIQAALVKLAKAIQDTNGQGEALFASFVQSKWAGPADGLQHLLDHLVLASTGLVGSANVVQAAGDQECTPNGEACGFFPPGWSVQDRLWISTTVSCELLDQATTLDAYGVCQHHETVPELPFLVPVTLVQCYDGPASVSPSLAKVRDAFDDPDGTNFEDIEYFATLSSLPPGAPIPTCPTASLTRVPVPSNAAATVPSVRSDQKGGSASGLALHRGIGTQISAFSDWGFADTLSATIQGTISSSVGATPIAGAAVELLCGSETTARLAMESDPLGSYTFDNGTSASRAFLPGESCRVRASATGFAAGSTPAFTVAKGLGESDENVRNLSLEPASSILGVISSSVGATPVAGATVELFCGPDVSARQSTTSGTTGAYEFTGSDAVGGFTAGDTCEVMASKTGFASGSSRAFTVGGGTNVENVTLTPLQTSSTTVRGTVRHTPDGCGPVECSSTLVGGANVALACQEIVGAHPSSFTATTTTGSKGGSSSYGRYKFSQAPAGFGSGWRCTVTATFGTESGSAGPFAVLSGENVVNFQIF